LATQPYSRKKSTCNCFCRLDFAMRSGHALYVTSYDQLADTVQRLGARLDKTFVDGGSHPRLGTRNFTLPLQNGHHIEVVCPLDHPSPNSTHFGKAVSRRAAEGGDWLTWVFTVDDVSKIEKRLGHVAIDGRGTKPDGKDLVWKQIGVLGTLEDKQLLFFIEWLSLDHPPTDEKAIAKIVKVEIAEDDSRIEEWLGSKLRAAIGSDVEVEWVTVEATDGESGIVAVHVMTPSGVVRLD
jgi:hypothetical protein